MRITSGFKTMFAVAVMAAAVVFTGSAAQAATTVEKEIVTVGDTVSVYGKNLKINNKKTSKYKKKIKTVQTDNYADTFSYHTGSYFTAQDAYSTYDEYNNAVNNNKKYISYGSYELDFLKTGTYTISYDTYHLEDIDVNYEKYENGKSLYRITVEGKPLSDLFVSTYDSAVGSYYKGVNSGKIYAYGDGDYVPAVIARGADGRNHLKYNARKLIKDTHKTQYKVLKTTSPIASITLGKSKKTTKITASGFKYVSKRTTKKFLSGNSGKLTIKTSDKNYVINSIIIQTYDKDGNPVYTAVRNKSKINYGLNRAQSSYKSPYGDYYYESKSMYKPTTIHIGYTNKFTGAYSKYSVVTEKDWDGKNVQAIKSVYKYSGEGQKEQTAISQNGAFYGPGHTSSTFYKK